MNRSGNSFFSIMPPVTKHLIIINVLIWLAMMFVGKIDNMKRCNRAEKLLKKYNNVL